MDIDFRIATKEDCPIVLDFIKGIAEYENMSEEFVATEDLLNEWVFEKKKAEVLIGSVNGIDIGFALFFNNFSTFLGRAGLYLEDLFILEEHRGKGYGKAFLQKLAKICIEKKLGRLEWCCLNWNKPSIDFYLSLNARPMAEWTTYRLSGEDLVNLSK